ncbi:MAG: hypothetical protein H7068_13245, partial [Pedobacter sp.]|nr:hypothetical protein [Chitinophagaceae bacterium]
QLINNLITNSLKFSRPNVQPHIKITSSTVTGSQFQEQNQDLPIGKFSANLIYYHLRFIDNGIGFEPEYKNKIFELFQRLHGKEDYAGTGIGLAIVKKIVDNHNGIITASSELDKGATFDIYIPFG